VSYAEVILRRCPACERDSIIGHGRRRKQAHDEHHRLSNRLTKILSEARKLATP